MKTKGEVGLLFTLPLQFPLFHSKFTDVLKRAMDLETEASSPVSLPLSFFMTQDQSSNLSGFWFNFLNRWYFFYRVVVRMN